MLKRQATPLIKDRIHSRNSYNLNKPAKDQKTMQTKQSLSRNSSSSKLNITPLVTEPIRCNPESADKNKVKNRQFNSEMRRTTVEWMLEVSHRSKMKRQTIFMAVKMFDRGLDTIKDIGPANGQLLAVTCLFMSAKYEQIYPQSLNKFIDYTCSSYRRDQLVAMEQKILLIMDFKLTFDTRHTHACTFIEKDLSQLSGGMKRKFKSLVSFILQLTLLAPIQEYSEKQMGQAAVFLAAKVLKCSAPQVSYHEMESAFQMLQIWRENEGGLLAFLFDSEAESYVGGLRVIY